MKNTFSTSLTALAAAAILTAGTSAHAATGNVTYSGQGVTADGFGGYTLNNELCGVENGADAEGPYLLWVLTSTGATSASISGPWGSNQTMTRSGNGTYKYVSGWYDPATLPGAVTGIYNALKLKNAQLVISHGCRPLTTRGAWCSPGFWHNATDAAWALTGYSKATMFNGNVSTAWYGNNLTTDATLLTIVNNASTYSGPPTAGTLGYSLNAFNATGAFLSNNIPGYRFDPSLMNADETTACPIDHFGNFKTPS